jgi:ferredoxin-fold anticodon binding domain-containing protein
MRASRTSDSTWLSRKMSYQRLTGNRLAAQSAKKKDLEERVVDVLLSVEVATEIIVHALVDLAAVVELKVGDDWNEHGTFVHNFKQ